MSLSLEILHVILRSNYTLSLTYTQSHRNFTPESDVISAAEKSIITMRSVHDSVETVNAAATAIVAAEARVQPSTVQKRRWSGWWSLYSCFGSFKHDKRISHHAPLISETTGGGASAGVPATCFENPNHNAATVALPFIAPPSSPAAYLTSHSPSATNSPAASLSLSSLSVHASSPGMTAHIFLIGPYADETQLVSPPVFSAFTTQPSTASFTPPPEPLHTTTPPSPEVPFAQLLSQKWRNLSHYDFQPYQIKSPVSAVSTSGTSSPFFDKRGNTIELRVVEAPKYVGYEHFMNYTWGSRVGSRLGSGALTPSGGLSRLGSGALTPTENQISHEVVILESDDVVDHRRVSFELIGDDIPTCTVKEIVPSAKFGSETIREAAQGAKGKDLATEVAHSFRRDLDGNAEEWHCKNRSISFGSSIDFDFNNSKELGSQKNWSFFPMIQSGAVS